MAETPGDATSLPDVDPAWGAPLRTAICERCNWRFLLPEAMTHKTPLCPHCFRGAVAFGELSEMPYPSPPELVAPFTLSKEALQEAVQQFARGIPYAPPDLNYKALRSRLVPVYLPMWLVDASVQAQWQAEAGFNYEVVSHQERYAENGRGWQTSQVREARIRWESRLGRVRRACQNISAPALEESRALQQQLGEYNLAQLRPYDARIIERACVRLPDRSPQDAWSDAAAGFQRWGAAEVQKACASDHLRQFRWKARFDALNWTLMLLPAYSTYYLDDQGQPQAVLLHGQTGRFTGKRRASMQRAQQTSLVLLVIGLALAILGLGAGAGSMILPLLLPIAIVGLLAGLAMMLGALVPVGIAWDFNRRDRVL